MPSLASYLIQGTAVSTLTATAGFFLYTKHCEVSEPIDPATEPLFTSVFFRKYNPHNNHVSSDVVTRRIPLTHLRPDLLEDSRNGGSKLVETFCGNIWSGWQYTPQRLIHSRGAPASSQPPPDPNASSALLSDSPVLNEVAAKSKSTWSRLTSAFSSSSSSSQPTTSHTNSAPIAPTEPPQDLWSPTSLATSTYPPGTTITNHFLVLNHTPTAILVRCGSSPLDSPHSPRASDGLFEISATTNFEKGYAEFKLKSIFYNGTEEAKGNTKGGMSPTMWWLHQQYAKLWMQRAVAGCRMGRFTSQDKQRKRWEEEKAERKKAEEGRR